MDKQQAVLDILTKSDFSPRLSSSQNIAIRCPLAPYTPLHKGSRDGSPSMGIKVTEGKVLVNCFTCGFKSGQLSYLYSRLASYDSRWQDALSHVRAFEAHCLKHGLSALQYERQSVEESPLDESVYRPYARKLAPYLYRRGITIDTARRWDLGVDEEKRRALIPVRDQKNNLWGAVGRTYANEKPKYLNYWGLRKGHNLLGAQLIRQAKTTVIVEGSVDAMLTDQALRSASIDDYNVVSILGSSLSKRQAQMVVNMSHEVIIALDNDEAGHRGSSVARDLLGKRLMTRSTSPILVGKKDFGECSPSEIIHCIENARL